MTEKEVGLALSHVCLMKKFRRATTVKVYSPKTKETLAETLFMLKSMNWEFN